MYVVPVKYPKKGIMHVKRSQESYVQKIDAIVSVYWTTIEKQS